MLFEFPKKVRMLTVGILAIMESLSVTGDEIWHMSLQHVQLVFLICAIYCMSTVDAKNAGCMLLRFNFLWSKLYKY